ncbi:CLUMA_CG010142, isoform A [Clunio marinus]|uniref:CLUMA_CG010142, isoform A n=1 Tax=Clunio marinus TaxID=568069 RepID=A0A1J1I8Q3_9DIPT|nr:CLUMA_CG010142, isoform A [Clunio marinus]
MQGAPNDLFTFNTQQLLSIFSSNDTIQKKKKKLFHCNQFSHQQNDNEILTPSGFIHLNESSSLWPEV